MNRKQGPLREGADLPPAFPPPPSPLGLQSWDIDPGICSLDEQLKIFVSRHSATFSSIVKGEAGDPVCPSCPPFCDPVASAL